MTATTLDFSVSQDFWVRVGVAVLCGALIGIERQLRGKVAGVRTSILICLGTEVFVALGAGFGEVADPSRVLGQVVTGIGFLGTGVILARGGEIVGVTTAAVIWMLAAIGSAIGLGLIGDALALTGVTLAVAVGVRWVEAGLKRVLPTRKPGETQLED